MYLRTTRRKNKDGSIVEYYQLAHNERHPDTCKPTARIIHSLGRADKLDRDQLARLCNSIARVCGLKVIDPIDASDETQQKDSLGLSEDLKLINTLALGCVLVIEALWERLGIGKELRDICKAKKIKVPYERALLAMVANRLCEPESKLGVWDRWLSKVNLPSCQSLKLEQMYEAMDLLYDHRQQIEKNIFFHTANLFNLKVDLIFYDTTTASFSIDYEDEDFEESGVGLRKFGKSKENTWSPQVVVALAVTREGLPVRCWVFPGNTTDSTTVDQVRSDLRGWSLGRALFVADAGINSQDNREELARYPNKKATAQWAIELLASKRYKRYLTISKINNIRIDRGKVREAQKYDGKWVLETNDDTISMQDAASGHKGLMIIERCFRSLKRTQIKMCPMFHWVPRSIETHVRICVLALLIDRVAEIACQQPWSQIRRQLQTLQVIEFLTLKHRFFRRNELTPEVSQMLKTLDVPAPKDILAVANIG